jgi:hypothetical protein
VQWRHGDMFLDQESTHLDKWKHLFCGARDILFASWDILSVTNTNIYLYMVIFWSTNTTFDATKQILVSWKYLLHKRNLWKHTMKHEAMNKLIWFKQKITTLVLTKLNTITTSFSLLLNQHYWPLYGLIMHDLPCASSSSIIHLCPSSGVLGSIATSLTIKLESG